MNSRCHFSRIVYPLSKGVQKAGLDLFTDLALFGSKRKFKLLFLKAVNLPPTKRFRDFKTVVD